MSCHKLENKTKCNHDSWRINILTRWATALRFSGSIFNNFCFAGSYTPTKMAEALRKRTGSIEITTKYPQVRNHTRKQDCSPQEIKASQVWKREFHFHRVHNSSGVNTSMLLHGISLVILTVGLQQDFQQAQNTTLSRLFVLHHELPAQGNKLITILIKAKTPYIVNISLVSLNWTSKIPAVLEDMQMLELKKEFKINRSNVNLNEESLTLCIPTI